MTLTLTAELDAITPIELRNGIYYKRDDLLAFSNGVNGKVRTSMWLADYAKSQGATALVYGGSVHAPALGRVASAAAMTDMDCYLVIGSNIETARRHATVRVAEEAGASFIRSNVAYNPALQKKAREIACDDIFQVPYGVSTDDSWPLGRVKGFLEVDHAQTLNIPDEVETLVLPFGSGNAASSVLYSLAKHGTALKRVVLMGVGPDRREWLDQRLWGNNQIGLRSYDLEYIPLHPHYAVYADRMPETLDGIDFHPTYEGKVIRYLNQMKPGWWSARDGKTCFWIVGGP